MTNFVQSLVAGVNYALTDPSVPPSFRLFTVVLLMVFAFAAVVWIALPFALFGMSAAVRRIELHMAAMSAAQRELVQGGSHLDTMATRLRELTQANAHLDSIAAHLKELLQVNTHLGEIADRQRELQDIDAKLKTVVDRLERLREPRKGTP